MGGLNLALIALTMVERRTTPYGLDRDSAERTAAAIFEDACGRPSSAMRN